MAKIFPMNGTRLTVAREETCFEGSLEFTDSLIITGKFSGNIKSSGYLEIAKTGDCVVDEMTGSNIVVSGKVTGNITAEDSIELCSGSVITGDIKARKIKIEENVLFDGKVTMLDDVPAVDLFSMSISDYKQRMKQTDNQDKQFGV